VEFQLFSACASVHIDAVPRSAGRCLALRFGVNAVSIVPTSFSLRWEVSKINGRYCRDVMSTQEPPVSSSAPVCRHVQYVLMFFGQRRKNRRRSVDSTTYRIGLCDEVTRLLLEACLSTLCRDYNATLNDVVTTSPSRLRMNCEMPLSHDSTPIHNYDD